VLAEALAVVNKTGECLYEAEPYRLKGQLMLQSQVPSPKLKKKQRSVSGRPSTLRGGSRRNLWNCGR
jgi:hypothetical protein